MRLIGIPNLIKELDAHLHRSLRWFSDVATFAVSSRAACSFRAPRELRVDGDNRTASDSAVHAGAYNRAARICSPARPDPVPFNAETTVDER